MMARGFRKNKRHRMCIANMGGGAELNGKEGRTKNRATLQMSWSFVLTVIGEISGENVKGRIQPT